MMRHGVDEVQTNPRTIKICVRADGGSRYETVSGVQPRGVPDWMIVSAPPEEQRTRGGRVSPGGWAVTHVPTGLAIIKGLTKADAALAARAIAREAPCLKDVTDEIGPAEASRDPYQSAAALIGTLQRLLEHKADNLREGDVPMIVELVRHDLVSRKELLKLPPAVQVAVDDALEQAARENPPARKRRVDVGVPRALLAHQLEMLDKGLRGRRVETELIGDASATARRAGLEMLAELLLDAYNVPAREAGARLQKVLRLQWPMLETAVQAAQELGWLVQRFRTTMYTLDVALMLYGGRARLVSGRTSSGGLLAEFTVDVRPRQRKSTKDLYDLYLSWRADRVALPEGLRQYLQTVQEDYLGYEPAWAALDVGGQDSWLRGRETDDRPRGSWRSPTAVPGPATWEYGLLCTTPHCKFGWPAMVKLYEAAPMWFDVLHAVIAKTPEMLLPGER